MKSPNHLLLLLGVLVVPFAGCGGGGGGGNKPGPGPTPPVVNLSPGGIFYGVVTGCSTVCPVNSISLIAEDGEWISMDTNYSGGANAGHITMNGAEFNDPQRYYSGTASVFGFRPTGPALRLTPNDTRSFYGSVEERLSIKGTLMHNGNFNTKLDATYDPAHEIDSSLAAIAGTYAVSDATGYTLTYTIASDGDLAGSDTEGCLAAGAAQIIDGKYNVYRFTVNFTGCGAAGAAGTHNGLGALLDTGTGSKALLFAAIAADLSTLVVLELPKL